MRDYVNLDVPAKKGKFVENVFMVNTVEQELQQYLLRLNEAEKKSVLQLLKTFLGERNQKAERISIEQYNQELAEAEEQ